MSRGNAGRRPWVLVTGNANKRREAERIVGRRLETAAIDLPEIQSGDLIEVLRHKAEAAWQRLERPVVLELACMNGFPGPLVKWMLEAVGDAGIAKAAIRAGDPGVVARCALMLLDGDRKVIAEGATAGRLVLPPRGEGGFGWDPVFEPDGLERTYAELGEQVKDRIGHRGRAWRAFLRALDGLEEV
ncbi:MAG: non-canonical purine NTP pyrophosphatase [Acidobacteria bacterium]|nr:non-canonical purine NTP pyrophosphatase [Acidobacteriota bacterium]